MEIFGNVIIIIGVSFMLIGVVGLEKYKDFFARVVIAGQIDTVGALTIIIGIAVRQGAGFFSLKLLLLLAIIMVLNPLATHIAARSAYWSGHNADAVSRYAKTQIPKDEIEEGDQ